MDKQVSNRILNELDRVAELDNPRKRGKALTGQLSGLWRYRIGNYRAICMIENNELVILSQATCAPVMAHSKKRPHPNQTKQKTGERTKNVSTRIRAKS